MHLINRYLRGWWRNIPTVQGPIVLSLYFALAVDKDVLCNRALQGSKQRARTTSFPGFSWGSDCWEMPDRRNGMQGFYDWSMSKNRSEQNV